VPHDAAHALLAARHAKLPSEPREGDRLMLHRVFRSSRPPIPEPAGRLFRSRWPTPFGIGGRLRLESVAGWCRNTQLHAGDSFVHSGGMGSWATPICIGGGDRIGLKNPSRDAAPCRRRSLRRTMPCRCLWLGDGVIAVIDGTHARTVERNPRWRDPCVRDYRDVRRPSRPIHAHRHRTVGSKEIRG
jgi:hypothetical protein